MVEFPTQPTQPSLCSIPFILGGGFDPLPYTSPTYDCFWLRATHPTDMSFLRVQVLFLPENKEIYRAYRRCFGYAVYPNHSKPTALALGMIVPGHVRGYIVEIDKCKLLCLLIKKKV